MSNVRTRLTLDDDVLALVRAYATDRGQPLGRAVSELIRRGLTAKLPTRRVNGLLVFDLPAGSAVVSTNLVKHLEAEDAIPGRFRTKRRLPPVPK